MPSQTRTNAVISGAAINNSLVSATAGYRIRVLDYVLVSAGTLTARFLSSSTVEDSYSESNANSNASIYNGSLIRYGQSFNPSVSGLIETAKFYLKKTGAPTGNATAKLYAHTGTFGTSSTPTGAALGTSDTFDVSTLTTSSVLTTLTFTGANRAALTAGTKYCIEILYNDASSDSSNFLSVGIDTTSPTHGGNAFSYDSSYAAIAGTDMPFYVNASTYLTGAMTLIVGRPVSQDLQREGFFETVSGEALTMTLSTTTQVSGHLSYCLIEAT